jgi:hypothetical protein
MSRRFELVDEMRTMVEELATEQRGEYDGSEAEVPPSERELENAGG